MNEQELLEKFDRIAEALERMAVAADGSTEAVNSATTARRTLNEQETQEERLSRETISRLRDYNLAIKGNNQVEDLRKKTNEERLKQEKELNAALARSSEDFRKLSDAGKERYKADLRGQKAYDDQLKSINRYINEDGKRVKIDNELSTRKRIEIDILKQMDNVQQNLLGNTTKLGADLGKLTIKATFDMFVAGIKGAYEGTIAYQEAILDGAGANAAAAAQVSAEMNALAGALESTGSSMVSLGAEAAKTALQMIVLGGPIGMLVGVLTLLVGAAVAYEGYEKQAQAAKMKRDAELQKKQAAIYDELYKDFTQLSQASLTSAGGMTELWSQMNKLGMSVKDFSKFNRILVESASAMATFSSSAVEGVKKFTDVAGGVIKSGMGEIFRAMGMTNEDLADHTAKYMEQQARLGLMQGKSVADLQKGTANYIFELDRVATLTGQSRKEQEKARDAVKQIQQLRAAQFIARDKGDTAKANELATAETFAAAMMRVDPQLAAGIAKRASGAALDQDSILALRNIAPALEAMRNGETNVSKLMLLSGRSLEQQQRMYAGSVAIQGQVAGITANFGGTDDLVLQTKELNKKQDEANKRGEKFDPAKYLDKLREVTDPFTQTQAKIAQDAKETQTAFEHNVMGLSKEFPNIMKEAIKKLPDALSGPIMKFFEYVDLFGKYVTTFIGDPSGTIDNIKANTKEFFTGKTKQQQDAEELVEVTSKIKTLNAMLKNPEEAKKLAEESLKLAKKEYEEKDKAVTELNVAYNKEKDINKKKEIEQKQILAMDAVEAARKKKNLAEKAVSDTDTGMFGYTNMNRSADQSQLKALEARKATLTASTSAAGGGASTMGAGDPSGGGGSSKPKLKSISSRSGPSAQVNEAVADNFQNLINHLDMAGYKINSLGGYNDRDVRGQTGVKSAHAKGAALDINSATNPMSSSLITDLPENIGTIAGNLGLGWGGNWQSKKDAMHFSATRGEGGTLMARNGGVFNGPPGGYPVELHGREAVVPLPNPGDKISIDRGQTSGSASKDALSSVVSNNTTVNNGSGILVDLYSMMESKFDDLIDKMDTNNKYTDKILKYSQV